MKNTNVTFLYNNISKLSYNIEDTDNQFNPYQVGNLINQAADLLDRCLSDLMMAKSFETQAANLALELEEEKKLIDLYQSYIDDLGLDDEIKLLSHQLECNSANRPHYEAAKQHAQQAYDHQGNQNSLLWAQTGRDLNIANVELIKIGQQESDIKLRQGMAERSKKHSIDKYKVQKGIYNQKKQLTSDQQILDFQFQSELATQRCERDFHDAYSRILFANKGLKEIYDFPGPHMPTNPSDLGENDKPIHTSISWVRDVIQWITRFTHHDQSFTLTISLRQLMREGFEHAINNDGIFKFRIPESYFRNHSYVRLKGLSAFINSSQVDGKVPWSILLRMPELAKVKYEEDYTTINQEVLPILHLGRVDNRSSKRNPEIVGLISHINASPIGDSSDLGRWSLEIDKMKHDFSDFKIIDDIQLELILIGHTV